MSNKAQSVDTKHPVGLQINSGLVKFYDRCKQLSQKEIAPGPVPFSNMLINLPPDHATNVFLLILHHAKTSNAGLFKVMPYGGSIYGKINKVVSFRACDIPPHLQTIIYAYIKYCNSEFLSGTFE
jgi:hypothetical protein